MSVRGLFPVNEIKRIVRVGSPSSGGIDRKKIYRISFSILFFTKLNIVKFCFTGWRHKAFKSFAIFEKANLFVFCPIFLFGKNKIFFSQSIFQFFLWNRLFILFI